MKHDGRLGWSSSPMFLAYGRLRFDARNILARSPRLYLPLARWRRRQAVQHASYGPEGLEGERPFDDRTEIVIDGFWRSANTFALAGFVLAQPRPVIVAHHMHAPSQFIAAARAHVPAILTIREPTAAAVSLVIMEPMLSLGQVLRVYIRFHRSLLPYIDDLVVATFPQITSDLGGVIERVNACYGTTFCPFDQSSDQVRRAIALVEQRHRPEAQRVGQELAISRPSSERKAAAGSMLKEIEGPRYASLRSAASEIFDRFAEVAR
jgi:hypothetical protein